jgi:hypothetical protein
MKEINGKVFYEEDDNLEEIAKTYRKQKGTFLPPFDNIKFGEKIPEEVLKEGYIKVDTASQQIYVNPFKCNCGNFVVYNVYGKQCLKENGEIIEDDKKTIFNHLVL